MSDDASPVTSWIVGFGSNDLINLEVATAGERTVIGFSHADAVKLRDRLAALLAVSKGPSAGAA